ncbi:MAG: hypothetical protein ABID38_01910, partial [Candidatus Diapherotrites archaeon]
MKKELLLVFCLVLLFHAVSAQSDAECDADSRCLFYSSWNTEPGDCGLVPYSGPCTDGGTWAFGWGFDQPMQNPYISSNGPGGNNFLNMVTVGDDGYGSGHYLNFDIINSNTDIFYDPDDLYVRVYFRVHDDAIITAPNKHWFQLDAPSEIRNVSNALSFSPDTTASEEIPELAGADYVMEGMGRFVYTTGMEDERWYCWELHVESVDEDTERRYVRLDGEDITDESFSISGDYYRRWLSEVNQNEGFENKYYGNLWVVTYDMVGPLNNGWDVAAIEVRDDHWVGCFDE